MSESHASDESIILIGPEGAGKTTIGKIIAETLSKELYSLDRHRDELYAPYGYDREYGQKIYKEHGTFAFLAYWKPFEFQTVQHILQNANKQVGSFYGKILDFGAGHSVYENPEQLHIIAELMKPYRNVILVLPCDDVAEAVEITEARRGHQLEYNKLFMEHESNRRLAKHVVYTKDRTPEECAQAVLQIIRPNAPTR